MPPRNRFLFSVLSVVFFLLAALPIYRQLSQRSDIWWTPKAMLVPLAASGDRVEIYARGMPLTALIQAGQIQIVEDGGPSVLATTDVGLRLNNWDRVRAASLPLLLMNAAFCGAMALLFLLILTGRLAYRPEKERAGARAPEAPRPS